MSSLNSSFPIQTQCRDIPDVDLELLSQSQSSQADSDYVPSNSQEAVSSSSGSESNQVIMGKKLNS
jgi:hypothetical protein